MLTLLGYLINREYLPSIVWLPYSLVGVSLAILMIGVIGWRHARQDSGILRLIAFMCTVAAEWPLFIIGFFVFACVEEWRGRG